MAKDAILNLVNTKEKIWVFEIQDNISGGIIIANSENEAWNKLAENRKCSIEQLKDATVIYPLIDIVPNVDVYDLW